MTRDHSAWPTEVVPAAHHILPSASAENCVVTFVNHTSCLIQTGTINILTDPQYSDRASPVSWTGPYRVHEPGIAYDKLPRIDVVIISHDHYDHMDKKTLQMLYKDHQPHFLVGLGNDVHLKSFGITENVKTLDWWQQIQIANSLFTFVPVQHFSSRVFLIAIPHYGAAMLCKLTTLIFSSPEILAMALILKQLRNALALWICR